MGIPNKEAARYNSLQDFIALTKGRDNAPAMQNLYSVRIATPNMLRQGGAGVSGSNMQVETSDLDWQLDYYCDSIQLPSKQITTGQVQNVGSGYKYATNTAYSQINMTFTVPRSQYNRNFFERWTTVMTPDSEQYTQYYNEYTCPYIMVYKWERGGGDLAITDPKMIRAIRQSGQVNEMLLARKYQLTACWEIQNAFPYNIGSIRLDQQKSKVMSMTIGFYYERYRFYTDDKFDDPGVLGRVTLPASSDNYNSSSSNNNTDFVRDTLFSGFPLSASNTG